MLLFAECLLTIAYVRVALRFAPQRVLAGAVGDGGTSNAERAAAIAEQFARVVARQPISTNCLHRALALRMVLGRRRIGARLRIGMQRRPAILPGHAWLEVGGRVINDEAGVVERYVPLEVSETALRICYSRSTA